MASAEKKINKRLVWAIIWGAVLGGAALSSSKKGKSFWSKVYAKAKWFIDTAIKQWEKVWWLPDQDKTN
jgi:hypothetical protein